MSGSNIPDPSLDPQPHPRPDPRPDPGATRHRHIIVYPDYRTANPYQRLLYRGIDPLFLPELTNDWQQSLHRASEPFVFHLHWEDAIYRMQPDPGAAHIQAQRFVDAISRFKDRGGQLLWTIHNQRPHDGRYIEVHEALSRALEPMVELFLTHHPTASAFVEQTYGVPPSKIAVVPHGNFADEYSPLCSGRSQRRHDAGYRAEDRLLLLFGRLDSYKGARELLQAVATIDDPRLHLLIAGKQVDNLSTALAALPEPIRERIAVRDGFVPNDQVAELFDLADVVATPYRAILTSGTAMLALSMRRPVLAPDLPGIKEWITDGKDGLLYPSDRDEGLGEALRRFLNLEASQLEWMQDQARTSALRHQWASVSNLLNGIYAGCALRQKPPRLASSIGWHTLD